MSEDTAIKLNFNATASLALEGTRNELIRVINSLRKKADLSVTSRVTCYIETDNFTKQMLDESKSYIESECLLDSLVVDDGKFRDTKVRINDNETVVPFKKMHSPCGIEDGKVVFSRDGYETYWHATEALL